MHIYICPHIRTHSCSLIRACARVCVFVCGRACEYVWMRTHTHTKAQTQTETHTRTRTHTHTHTPPPHTHTPHTHTHTPRFASDCEIHCLMCFYLGQVEFFFWVFLRHLHCTGSCVLCSSRTLARLSVVDPKVALCRQGDVKLQELTNLTVVWYHGRINQGPFFWQPMRSLTPLRWEANAVARMLKSGYSSSSFADNQCRWQDVKIRLLPTQCWQPKPLTGC